MGQGRLLVHVVREQILGAREARAQWVLRTVASEDFIGRVQPKRPEYFRIERLVDVIASATRDDEQLHRRDDGHRIATDVRSG